jgi:hypothetical protein
MSSQGFGLQDPRAPNPFADPRQQQQQPGIQYAQRSQYESESDHDHYGSVNASTTRLAGGPACPSHSVPLHTRGSHPVVFQGIQRPTGATIPPSTPIPAYPASLRSLTRGLVHQNRTLPGPQTARYPCPLRRLKTSSWILPRSLVSSGTRCATWLVSLRPVVNLLV